MATEYIGTPPVSRVISVTKDCERKLNFARIDNVTDRNPVDWTGTVYMEIDIDTVDSIQASIVEDVATVLIPSEVANLAKKGTTWRVINAITSDYEIPIAVGTFERHDGK